MAGGCGRWRCIWSKPNSSRWGGSSNCWATWWGCGWDAAHWIQQAASTLEPVEEQLTAALRRAPVLHSDETGVRRARQLAWAHVACTDRLTHYAIHARRGGDRRHRHSARLPRRECARRPRQLPRPFALSAWPLQCPPPARTHL